MKVLGMISGTSHDGIDVAIVDFAIREGPLRHGPASGQVADGPVLDGRVIHVGGTPYDPALRSRLQATLPPAELRYADVCELDTLIGQAFAVAAESAVRAAGTTVDLVCSHGQTVFHWVEGNRARGTLQVGQPAWIADRLGVPVVADVRIRDIVAGGQGAPLVAHLDTLLLAGVSGSPAALNLGGIANVTVLRPPGRPGPIAYDIGPANALIDAAARMADPAGPGYDDGGRIAASGKIREDLLDDLLAEPYYRLPIPRTTGKELFHADYLAAAVARHEPVAAADVVATVTALTARIVAQAVDQHGADSLWVSGGGWHNPTLRSMLGEELPGVSVRSSDRLGAPVDVKEAIAFALIGWHTWHGLPATVPDCTGAGRASILGSVTPGAAPLRLPAPLSAAPAALTLRGDHG